MNHLSKILLPLLATAISCTPEVIPSAPTVSGNKAEVTRTTKYVTLSASVTNPRQVSEAGFYVSADASMSYAEKIVAAEVSDKISAKYLPQGYGKTYYYKAFISNGRDERCSEKSSYRTEKFGYYVNLVSSIESMTETTVTVSASLTAAKETSISSKGFCYGEKEDVTIADNVVEVISPEFKAELPCSKDTYIRAYVREGDLVAYSTALTKADIIIPDAIDLGLSVKWASFNVGASKPEEYGNYYAWGELGAKTIYDWSTYKWCNGTYEKMIKYNTVATYGVVDNRTVLEADDDIASTLLGDKWRMPSVAEIKELMSNCTLENCLVGGVYGCKFTSRISGYSDKWIFLPAAGYRGSEGIEFEGEYCDIWSSSYVTYNPKYAYSAHAQDYIVDIDNRFWGYPVRAVYGDRIPVSGVRISNDAISLIAGDTFSPEAIISPSNATEKGLVWSTSDESVVTVVEYSGNITAVKEGKATITVKTVDGGYTATCQVTVTPPNYNGHEYVDLGLSVKWATCNVGASKPEDYGGYYQWAGTKDVSSKSIYLDWSNCPYHTGTYQENGWAKYNTISSYGTVDNKTVLDLSDDAARVNWGGSWRMPTDAECRELRNNCIWVWTTQNGVKGYKATSKKSGYTNKSIFLPATGARIGDFLLGNDEGSYWSSTLETDKPHFACLLGFRSDIVWNAAASMRSYGLPVRPVSK